MTALVVLALAFAQVVYCAPSGCGCGPYYPGPYPLPGPGCGSYPVPLPYPEVVEYPVGPVYPGPGCGSYPVPLPYPEVVEYPVGPVYPGPGCGSYPGPYPGYPEYPIGPFYPEYPVYPGPGLEESCCPGPVIEKKTVIQKPVTIPYSYSEPTFSKKCYQRGTVSREVVPSSFESTPVCETVEQVTRVPSTDITTVEQPLCKTTCTTSEYVIQIPIVETTCTSSPLCKKTVRTQDNLLTNVAKQVSCAKQVCTQNKVIEQPFTETVCQNYEGAITKTGSQTILKPEVVKSCVQLPPYKCLKPAPPGPILYEGAVGVGGYAGGYFGDFYPGGVAYGGPGYVEGYPFGGSYGCNNYVVDVPPSYYPVGPASGCSCIA